MLTLLQAESAEHLRERLDLAVCALDQLVSLNSEAECCPWLALAVHIGRACCCPSMPCLWCIQGLPIVILTVASHCRP